MDPEPDWAPRSWRERPSGNWAWRWCSPSMLCLSLLLLPLPFLEVQCAAPMGPSMAILNQSGLQVMTGGYSISSRLDEFNRQMQAGLGMPAGAAQAPLARKDELNVKPAYLMVGVPILFLVAVAVGLAVGRTAIRVPIVGSLIAVSLALVFVQMATGFPLDREVRDSIQREAQRGRQQLNPFDGPGKVGMPPGGGFPKDNPLQQPLPVNDPFRGVDALASLMIQTYYTPWFWMWLVLIFLALGPLVAETIWAANRQSRWRPDYDRGYY
jgi:hypothetical protein